MSESDSTTSAAVGKPAKPYPDSPLFAHAAGVWAKKIRGKLHYFGPWADPDAALKEYPEQKDALHSGCTTRPDPEAVTVKGVVNPFLNARRDKMNAGELSVRTWAKYKEATDLLVGQLGESRLVADLAPDNFTALKNQMTKRWGPRRVADFVQHIRSVFKHALDADLVGRPVRFGPGFARPTAKVLRLHRAKQGPKLFPAEEVRALLGAAGSPLKAMLLLGINCGFGNTDVGTLPLSVPARDGGRLPPPVAPQGGRREAEEDLTEGETRALKALRDVHPEPLRGKKVARRAGLHHDPARHL
jgi:hypothetical protein